MNLEQANSARSIVGISIAARFTEHDAARLIPVPVIVIDEMPVTAAHKLSLSRRFRCQCRCNSGGRLDRYPVLCESVDCQALCGY